MVMTGVKGSCDPRSFLWPTSGLLKSPKARSHFKRPGRSSAHRAAATATPHCVPAGQPTLLDQHTDTITLRPHDARTSGVASRCATLTKARSSSHSASTRDAPVGPSARSSSRTAPLAASLRKLFRLPSASSSLTH